MKGHQTMICIQEDGDCFISLECSCGAHFHTGRFAMDSMKARIEVRAEGRAAEVEHQKQIRELVR